MKLKDWAIEILMADLGASCQSSMLAIYLMATGGDMSENVTKLDLTKIIFVLCKQLDWVADNGSGTEFEPDVDQSSTKNPGGNDQFPRDDDITCGSNVKGEMIEDNNHIATDNNCYEEEKADEALILEQAGRRFRYLEEKFFKVVGVKDGGKRLEFKCNLCTPCKKFLIH